jgi:hypothetical protein
MIQAPPSGPACGSGLTSKETLAVPLRRWFFGVMTCAGGDVDRVVLPVLLHDVHERVLQRLQTLVRDRGDLEDRPSELLFEFGTDDLGHLAGVGDVHLVEDDDTRTVAQVAEPGVLGQLGLVVRQFVLQGTDIVDGIALGLQRGAVDDVCEHRGALDVPQEVQAQTLALRRPGDQSGHVGDGEDAMADIDHTEVRLQRGEGVVSDLRLRRRQNADQGGLTGRGESDESDVRHGLQLDGDVLDLTGLTEQSEAGGLAGSGDQRRVAEATVTAGGDDDALTLGDHVGDDLTLVVEDDGAGGYPEDQVLATGTVAVVPGTVAALALP